MHKPVSQLEQEYFGQDSGFQIIMPFEQREQSRPRGSFLRKQNLKRVSDDRRNEVACGFVISPTILRTIDKRDLKENMFHKLWLAGFVDRNGMGTNELRKAILSQTMAFDGEPKIADAEILELIGATGVTWQFAVIKKFGWCSLFLASSLQKAKWFEATGKLSEKAEKFIRAAKGSLGEILASNISEARLLIMNGIALLGKKYPVTLLREEKSIEVYELEKTIYWLSANKLIDAKWNFTELGENVLVLARSKNHFPAA